MELGLSLIISVMLIGGLGFGLDRWMGTLPLCMLLGGLLGFVAWFYQVWKSTQRKAEDVDEKQDGGQG